MRITTHLRSRRDSARHGSHSAVATCARSKSGRPDRTALLIGSCSVTTTSGAVRSGSIEHHGRPPRNARAAARLPLTIWEAGFLQCPPMSNAPSSAPARVAAWRHVSPGDDVDEIYQCVRRYLTSPDVGPRFATAPQPHGYRLHQPWRAEDCDCRRHWKADPVDICIVGAGRRWRSRRASCRRGIARDGARSRLATVPRRIATYRPIGSSRRFLPEDRLRIAHARTGQRAILHRSLQG
jgi:hypothetical protein